MASEEVPEKLRDLTGLGDLIGYYPVQPSKRWLPVFTGILLIILSLAIFLYGSILSSNEMVRHGTAVVGEFIFWPALFSVMAFIGGLWGFWLAYSRWQVAVAIFQKGFAFVNLKGIRSWIWQDVSSVQMGVINHSIFGIHTRTSHRYQVRIKAEKPIGLDNSFFKVDELGRYIEENTFPHLYSHASNCFNNGEEQEFGKVILVPEGLQIAKKSYPWDQIDRVTIQRGVLQIIGKGSGSKAKVRLPVAGISNSSVLLSILDQVIGVKIEP